jgi:hypothetical protein
MQNSSMNSQYSKKEDVGCMKEILQLVRQPITPFIQAASAVIYTLQNS